MQADSQWLHSIRKPCGHMGKKVKMQSRNLCKYPNDLKAYLELCISNENGIVHLEFKGLLVEISIK